MTDGPERLHKFLARCGVTSRRKAEALILDGRIAVNGEIVTQLGSKVSPGDDVRMDGALVREPRLSYVLLHKPKGIVTTLSDPQGRRTIVGLLPDVGAVLKPVGRLDQDTEGLLLCTNDGELAMRLTHPRHGVEKEYHAVVRGAVAESSLARLRRGVVVEGRKTAPAVAEALQVGESRSTLKIILHEGRKRQVRQMCLAVGHPVIELRRVRIGPLRLQGLRPGECRVLSRPEIEALRRIAGLTAAP